MRMAWRLLSVCSLVFVAIVTARAGTWTEDEAKIAACFAAMDREPALTVVNAKFARREPTAAQLADRSLPSEEEVAALRLRVAKTRPCRELRLKVVKAHHPLLEPAYITLYYQADQVFSYLTDAVISYGIANRLAGESLSAFRARERAYFAAGAVERRALSERWSEALQRAHSNPPPSVPARDCAWQDLNIACE
jgi:hypothetical protein